MKSLTLVIPCYNEEGNLPQILKKIDQLYKVLPDLEVVVVNNGSKDSTAKILEKEVVGSRLTYIKVVTILENKGYGYGILKGLEVAQSSFLAWTHADLQTDLMDVVVGFNKIREANNPKNTLVKGKRSGRNFFDTFFTFGMTLVSSLALNTWVSDVNAQPKIFSRKFYNLMTDPPLDFSLDLYVLYIAKKNNFNILTIPVLFKERLYGEAKGGASIWNKWGLIKRTFSYIKEFKK